MNFKQIWNNKSYRIIIIVTLSVIVSFLLINLLLSTIINEVIKPNVLAKVSTSNTQIKIEHAGYSIFTNKLSLKNISLLHLDGKDTISIRAGSSYIYINWFHLAFRDGYSFSGIEADSVVMNQSFIPKAEPEKKQDNSVFSFLDSLPAKFPYFESDYIILSNASLIRKDLNSGLTDSIRGLDLQLNEVLLDTNSENLSELKIAREISISVEKVKMYFGNTKYKLIFDGLSLSSAEKTASLNNLSLEPYLNDNNYFLTKKFRSDRFRFSADIFSVQGFDFSDLVLNSTITADKILLKNFSFDALTNMRLPEDPNAELPKMPNQVVNEIPFKLNIKKMDMINGNILVKEIYPYDQKAGVLQFADFNALATNIRNNYNVHFNINTRLAGSGKLDVKFNIGLYPGKMKFDYSGKLGQMKATDLNKFIVVADRVQVMSGDIQGVNFRIDATGDAATGTVTPLYSDLSVNELDDETGKASGLLEKFNSFIANTFIIKKNNLGEKEPETATTVYVRQPNDAFMEYVWKALRTALGEVVGFE